MEKFIHLPSLEKIEFFDERFYRIPAGTLNTYTQETIAQDLYYPSVTTILGIYPKEKAFLEWVKSLGYNVDIVVKQAAESGSKIHSAVHALVNRQQVTLMENSIPKYTIDEWSQVCKVHEFLTLYEPTILASEITVVDHKRKIAGTLDLVLEIDGKRYVVDLKTSRNLYKENELQVAVYAYMWNLSNPDLPIDYTAILWTKSLTKGPGKMGESIQGKGWQLKVYGRHYSEALKIFDHLHSIWMEENPNPVPTTLSYPTVLRFS